MFLISVIIAKNYSFQWCVSFSSPLLLRIAEWQQVWVFQREKVGEEEKKYYNLV